MGRVTDERDILRRKIQPVGRQEGRQESPDCRRSLHVDRHIPNPLHRRAVQGPWRQIRARQNGKETERLPQERAEKARIRGAVDQKERLAYVL